MNPNYIKTINNGALRKGDVGSKVTLFGWVSVIRKLKNLTFIDLRDRWGVTQLVLRDIEFSATKESVLRVEGLVALRRQANPDLATGEIEVNVSHFEVLSLAAPLPFDVTTETTAPEDLRLTYRYLDLRRQPMLSALELRSQFVNACRTFLQSEQFMEIDTPILGKTTPEGARDFLVPTRRAEHFFALPQSPQLYKQLLMASGIERYFQVARVFRDEDLRKDRQFEFTQLDIEKSFTSISDFQALVERLMSHALRAIGRNIKTPFIHMDYAEAMRRFGSDKPDTRYGCELQTLTADSKHAVLALSISEKLTNSQEHTLKEIALKNKLSQLFVLTPSSKIPPALASAATKITSALKSHGVLLVGAGALEAVQQGLGAVRVELNAMFKWADSRALNFLWVDNWPLFEIDGKKIAAAHHPFTAPDAASLATFDTKPDRAMAQAYDLVLNGFEVAGGSVRIHDAAVQARMFKTIGLSAKEATAKFGFFLEAFKYGLPPHAGIALGLDRLIMVLAEMNSIRDVIAFPKNAHGQAMLEGSPSELEVSKLADYGLTYVKKPAPVKPKRKTSAV